MERLIKLVYVDDKYIRFLFSFDKRVMYNKGQSKRYFQTKEKTN